MSSQVFDELKTGGKELKKAETKSADFALERAKLESQLKAGKKIEEVNDVSQAVIEAYKEEQAHLAAQ